MVKRPVSKAGVSGFESLVVYGSVVELGIHIGLRNRLHIGDCEFESRRAYHLTIDKLKKVWYDGLMFITIQSKRTGNSVGVFVLG